jgi:hypothetical protein
MVTNWQIGNGTQLQEFDVYTSSNKIICFMIFPPPNSATKENISMLIAVDTNKHLNLQALYKTKDLMFTPIINADPYQLFGMFFSF